MKLSRKERELALAATVRQFTQSCDAIGVRLEEVIRAFIEKNLRSHCKASGLPSARAVAVLGAMLSKVLAEAVVVVEEEWQAEAMRRGALQ
jgi:hypothetical protein